MSIIDSINTAIKESQKSGQQERLAALRLILNALKNQAKDLRVEQLDDQEAIKVLQKEVKKRKESISAFQQGGRPELAAKEQFELDLISPYLPAELSDQDIKKIIDQVVADQQLTPPFEFGKLMGAVMKEVAGRADGQKVGQAVQNYSAPST